MRNAFLLRTPDKHSVVVLMRSTLAVVHAELTTALTPEQFKNAQGINAMSPIAADVELGPYDMNRTRFTNCSISVDLPVSQSTSQSTPQSTPQSTSQSTSQHTSQTHKRVDYSNRRR